jgi:hypothetical protein
MTYCIMASQVRIIIKPWIGETKLNMPWIYPLIIHNNDIGRNACMTYFMWSERNEACTKLTLEAMVCT